MLGLELGAISLSYKSRIKCISRSEVKSFSSRCCKENFVAMPKLKIALWQRSKQNSSLRSLARSLSYQER